MTSWRIEVGDCRDVLRRMPARSVHTVVTSPPYFGLRDYGTGEWEGGDPACNHRVESVSRGQRADRTFTQDPGLLDREACRKCGARRVDRQIGLEPTPDEFVAALVAVFREVRRVLRDDGTVWLNLGDSFAGGAGGRGDRDSAIVRADGSAGKPSQKHDGKRIQRGMGDAKPKDLLGIPWMVAFALRADGWYLRSDIIWSKPNPMPESVTDRPTKAHEYVFLLSKGPRYFYDADAIREAAVVHDRPPGIIKPGGDYETQAGRCDGNEPRSTTRGFGADELGRNKRSVWTVATQPYAGAHFATFPPKLIEPCILAGAPERACGECGAPWVRVVERTAAEVLSSASEYGHGAGRNDGGRSRLVGAQARTLGFEPSCSHGDGSAHGVVLDPFAGAGTTGIVALQHGREFVGIELNPEYARMARGRIETAVRLGFRAPQNGREQIPGQLDIFGVA